MSKYDWSSFTEHTLILKNMSTPREICKYFSTHKIDKYVYCIENLAPSAPDNNIIKYGMSAPDGEDRDWGERLYRQIAHCNTWGRHKIVGSSGSDWLSIEQEFLQKYKTALDHRNLSLTVWDVTNYDFDSFDPIEEIKELESEKIMEFIKMHGQPPIGNVKERPGRFGLKGTKTTVSVSLFRQLFDDDIE